MHACIYALQEPLQKEVDFNWTKICNGAFEKLKCCLQ